MYKKYESFLQIDTEKLNEKPELLGRGIQLTLEEFLEIKNIKVESRIINRSGKEQLEVEFVDSNVLRNTIRRLKYEIVCKFRKLRYKFEHKEKK